ncbi:MAG: hypothetical protein M0018_00415 [Nitrospiraceae bacterium]|nr:hypothetical protein [Nitrospiraceae bacterium]
MRSDPARAERLREVIGWLSEVNNHAPVIVEGKKDAQALARLGLKGEIITVHRGKGLYDFSEDIVSAYRQVVLLPDWDEKGEQLMHALGEHLRGHFEEFSFFRETLKILCQKDVKDVEGIPSLLNNLEGFAGANAPVIE